MRRGLIILFAIGLMLAASPAFAQDSEYELGTFSFGLGYGFGDDVEPGPFIGSVKYWDEAWELGTEVYFSGDDTDEFDQIGMVWLAWRYDVSLQEDSATYVGVGGAGIFEDWNGFENQLGPVALVGWDTENWGAEIKYAWFDPGIASLVVYYHFDTEQ